MVFSGCRLRGAVTLCIAVTGAGRLWLAACDGTDKAKLGQALLSETLTPVSCADTLCQGAVRHCKNVYLSRLYLAVPLGAINHRQPDPVERKFVVYWRSVVDTQTLSQPDHQTSTHLVRRQLQRVQPNLSLTEPAGFWLSNFAAILATAFPSCAVLFRYTNGVLPAAQNVKKPIAGTMLTETKRNGRAQRQHYGFIAS